jgi:hypothetical protein
MASIQRLVRTKFDPINGKPRQITTYRVSIRWAGLKPITKTFSTRKLAVTFARRIEGDQEAAEIPGGTTSVVLRKSITTTLPPGLMHDE